MAPRSHALCHQPRPALRDAWDALRAAQPGIRPREAALALGVSEAELVATGCGEHTVRLSPPWPPLLAGLSLLGRVVAQTRTARSVLEERGLYPSQPLRARASGGIDVRPACDRWFVGYAAVEAGVRQLAFYDRSGTAVHKVFVLDGAQGDAWEALARRHAHAVQLPVEYLAPPSPVRARPDMAVDVPTLRTGWAALQGHDGIDVLLHAHQVTRIQGLRLVGPRWAVPISCTSLPRVLRHAAIEGIPLTITVANHGGAQAYRGSLSRVYFSGRWLNARALDVSLQVRHDRVASAWLVRAPIFAGMTERYEFFDAHGEPVLQLASAREEGEAEPDRWRALVRRVADIR